MLNKANVISIMYQKYKEYKLNLCTRILLAGILVYSLLSREVMIGVLEEVIYKVVSLTNIVSNKLPLSEVK